MSSLFRKEALENKQNSVMGDVILIRPLSFYVLTGFIVFFTVCLFVLLFLGKYADKQVVHGRLIPDTGIVKIFAPKAGVISGINVKDGDLVKKGQVLMTLDSESSLESGSSVNTLILDELKESLEKAKIDKANLDKEFSIREKNYNNRISAIKRELTNLNDQLSSQKGVVLSFKERAKREKQLYDKGVSALDRWQRVYEEFVSQKARFDTIKGQKIGKESELEQIEADLEQLPVKKESQANQAQQSISSIKQKIIEVEGGKRVAIISPVDGRLTSLQARKGSYHKGHETAPLVSILPEGAKLQAEVYLLSKAIGFVETGQYVRIKYQAFPYQQYGVYKGKIVEVAKNALMPNELAEGSTLPATFNVHEPVYKIRIELDTQEVTAFGGKFALQADMLLDADIVLRERTIFQKLFLDPIYRFKGSI